MSREVDVDLLLSYAPFKVFLRLPVVVVVVDDVLTAEQCFVTVNNQPHAACLVEICLLVVYLFVRYFKIEDESIH